MAMVVGGRLVGAGFFRGGGDDEDGDNDDDIGGMRKMIYSGNPKGASYTCVY